MPLQYFLEVSGLSGPSNFEAFAGAFNVLRFDFEAAHPPFVSMAGEADDGRSDFRSVNITLPDETGLTAFLSLVTNESRVGVSLIGTKPGGADGPQEVQRINLAGAVVSEVRDTDAGGYVVVLNYSQIGFVEQTQLPNGSVGTPETFGFDANLEAAAPVPPNAVPGPAIAAAHPARYFLLIDGVDGGSTDARHAGWFELQNFELDPTSLFTRTKDGSTTDRVDLNALRVTIEDESGVARLLSKLATGNQLAGARIEGVNPGGQVVYKLDIADVHVSRTSDTQIDGYFVDLDFQRIQLVTRGQDENTGALGPPQTFSYNATTASPNIGTLPTLAAGATDGPRQATQFYLQVDNVGGPSNLEVVAGGFHVDSYSFTGLHSESGGAGGGATGVTTFNRMTVVLSNDAGVTDFLKLLSSGVHTPAVSLVGLSAGGGGPSEAYRINLGDVVVTQVSQLGDGKVVVVSLEYRQIGVIQQTQTDTGAAGTPQTFGYDVDTAHEIPPPPAAHPATAIADATPAKFFMLVNGVDGGSTDADHVGWFELPFGFNYSDVSTAAAGGMVGKVVYNPLEVSFEDPAGLTTLLQKLATGGQISGVRIEGVTSDGHTVYKLDAADVRVTNVTENAVDGYRASFDYGRIQLVTSAQKPDGTYGLDQTFAYDVAGGKPGVGVLPTLAPASTDDPVDASKFFLEVAGLTGPSHQVHFEGAFNVQFFSFAADLATSLGGGGAGVGKAAFAPLQVVLTDESGLTAFLQLVASGAHTSAVSLIGAGTDGGALSEAYRVNLANVVVTDVKENTGHGYTVTLQYGEIGVVVQTEKPTGAAGTPQTFGYDITGNHSEPPPPDAAPGPPSPATGVSADHYFLLIDGIDGGSTDARHAGWFELPAFNFDILSTLTAIGSGAGVGKTVFAPVTVRLDSLSGLTDTLDSLALQHLIAGARIEGVSADGRTVYKLDIAEVLVTDVHETQTGGYTASLGFERIRLIIRAVNGDGSLGPEQVFTFNVETNSPSIGTLPDISPTGGAANHGPMAVADTAAVNENASVTIDVLANDTDTDVGDTKTLIGLSATAKGGHVSILAGKVVYVADADSFDLLGPGQSTVDSFSYTMRDTAGVTSTATVQVTVSGVANGPTQTGGSGNDSMVGTALDEKLDGAAGNDTLDGGPGLDTLVGGAGNDSLVGGAGIDSLSAGDGNDTIAGGLGDDVMAGARGNDVFVFGPHFGHDLVIDFKSVEDDIRFLGAGFTNFADVLAHAAQSGANVIITNAAGDSLQLNNVLLSSLQSGDFLFA